MWVGQRCALWTWMRAPAHARIPAQQRRAARHARRLLILRKHHTRTAARTRSCVWVYVCTCVCARALMCVCVCLRASACVCVRLRVCTRARTHACKPAEAWVRGCVLVQLGKWASGCARAFAPSTTEALTHRLSAITACSSAHARKALLRFSMEACTRVHQQK